MWCSCISLWWTPQDDNLLSKRVRRSLIYIIYVFCQVHWLVGMRIQCFVCVILWARPFSIRAFFWKPFKYRIVEGVMIKPSSSRIVPILPKCWRQVEPGRNVHGTAQTTDFNLSTWYRPPVVLEGCRFIWLEVVAQWRSLSIVTYKPNKNITLLRILNRGPL
jgi:hypothetical protein